MYIYFQKKKKIIGSGRMVLISVGEDGRLMNTNALNSRPDMWSPNLKVVCRNCGAPLRFLSPEMCENNKTPGYEIQCGCASNEDEKERARKNAKKVRARLLSREEQLVELFKNLDNLSQQFNGVKIDVGGPNGQDLTIRRGGDDIGIWIYWSGRAGIKVLCDWLEQVIDREKKQLELSQSGGNYCEVPSMVAILLDEDIIENGLWIPNNSTLSGLVKRGITLHGISIDGHLYEIMPSEKKTNKRLSFRKRMIRNLNKFEVTKVDHPKPESALSKTKIGNWIIKQFKG